MFPVQYYCCYACYWCLTILIILKKFNMFTNCMLAFWVQLKFIYSRSLSSNYWLGPKCITNISPTKQLVNKNIVFSLYCCKLLQMGTCMDDFLYMVVRYSPIVVLSFKLHCLCRLWWNDLFGYENMNGLGSMNVVFISS